MYQIQRCNHGEIFGATSVMVGQNLPPPPPVWNSVKLSENLGATAVAVVAPAVTSLPVKFTDACYTYIFQFSKFDPDQ